MLYRMRNTVRAWEEYILFDDSNVYEEIYRYCIADENDDLYPKNKIIQAIAQPGIKQKDLDTLDYFETLDGPMPIFSARLIDMVGDEISSDATWYPINIKCDGHDTLFYLINIKRRVSVIDADNSGRREVLDGLEVLSSPIYVFNHLDDEDFYLTRDNLERTYMFASEKFKALVTKHKLRMKFDAYSFKE